MKGGNHTLTSQENKQVKEYFEQTYKETNRSVTLFLISKCKNFVDVSDILQEVYMEYYKVLIRKGLDYIKEHEKFLISLCRKKIATYYSFWDRIPHKLYLDEKEDYEREELLSDAYDIDRDDVDDVFLQKEMIGDVKVLLKKQPDEVQKIFYLYYTMELKVSEIADLLHIKVHTVKNKLFRTRKIISEQLKDDWR